MSVKTAFKNSVSEKRWLALHEEKNQLQAKKVTPAIKRKVELINSLMTACKTGFNLTEAKVKKVSKFLADKTKVDSVKYGTIPDGSKTTSVLFKDIVVLYTEKDGQILFRENS